MSVAAGTPAFDPAITARQHPDFNLAGLRLCVECKLLTHPNDRVGTALPGRLPSGKGGVAGASGAQAGRHLARVTGCAPCGDHDFRRT